MTKTKEQRLIALLKKIDENNLHKLTIKANEIINLSAAIELYIGITKKLSVIFDVDNSDAPCMSWYKYGQNLDCYVERLDFDNNGVIIKATLIAPFQDDERFAITKDELIGSAVNLDEISHCIYWRIKEFC